MPWLSRKDYTDLLKRNDDRDFAAALRGVERVQSELRSFRTYVQRQFKALEGLEDDDEPAAEPDATPIAVPGGWSR